MSQLGAIGQYAIGQVPQISAAFSLTAEAGTYTLSGQAVTLSRGYAMAAGVGSYTLAGQDAGSARDRRLAAYVGTYTLAGQAVGLKAGHVLIASSQWLPERTSYAFPLFAALGEVALGGSKTVAFAAATTTYNLQGFDTQLRLGLNMPADAGAYALTGFDAGVRRTYALAANAGAYVLTGGPAIGAIGLTAAVGSYTLTGYDVTFLRIRKRIRGFGRSDPGLRGNVSSVPQVRARAA